MTVQSEILAEIKTYDRIIIHRHQRPDPDALGSQVGLAEILRATFPQKEIYQVGETVEGLRFLAEMQIVDDQVYEGLWSSSLIQQMHLESVMIVLS